MSNISDSSSPEHSQEREDDNTMSVENPDRQLPSHEEAVLPEIRMRPLDPSQSLDRHIQRRWLRQQRMVNGVSTNNMAPMDTVLRRIQGRRPTGNQLLRRRQQLTEEGTAADRMAEQRMAEIRNLMAVARGERSLQSAATNRIDGVARSAQYARANAAARSFLSSHRNCPNTAGRKRTNRKRINRSRKGTKNTNNTGATKDTEDATKNTAKKATSDGTTSDETIDNESIDNESIVDEIVVAPIVDEPIVDEGIACPASSTASTTPALEDVPSLVYSGSTTPPSDDWEMEPESPGPETPVDEAHNDHISVASSHGNDYRSYEPSENNNNDNTAPVYDNNGSSSSSRNISAMATRGSDNEDEFDNANADADYQPTPAENQYAPVDDQPVPADGNAAPGPADQLNFVVVHYIHMDTPEQPTGTVTTSTVTTVATTTTVTMTTTVTTGPPPADN